MKNPEKIKEYQENHREHDISISEWNVCLDSFGNTCAYCGLPVEEHIGKRKDKYVVMNLHKEHVEHDGYNDIRNAVPSCRSCNSSKRQHDMEEWFRKQKFFSQDRLNKIIWWMTEGYKSCIEEKLPYKILRKKNEVGENYHYELWSINELRNLDEIIIIDELRENIVSYIENGLQVP